VKLAVPHLLLLLLLLLSSSSSSLLLLGEYVPVDLWPLMDYCENGSKPSVSMEGQEIPDWLSDSRISELEVILSFENVVILRSDVLTVTSMKMTVF
jgi:hypothetical protein